MLHKCESGRVGEKPNKVTLESRVKRLEFCGGCRELLVASKGEWGFRFEGEIKREEGGDPGGHGYGYSFVYGLEIEMNYHCC